MNHQRVDRALIIAALTGTLFSITVGADAVEMPSAGDQIQSGQAPARVRRSITICELLRFNFDVKAKLYNQVSEPVTRDSYRADIQDIERLMNEAACK